MTHNDLNEADRDTRVIRELSRLPALSPSPGFGDRVMARVRLPQPKAVVLFRRARAWALEPRRAFALAAGYVVTAITTLGFAVPWLLAHSAAFRVAGNWFSTQILGGLREWALTLAGWAFSSDFMTRVASIGSGRLIAGAAVVTAVYGGCGLMLHRLLRAPRGTHAARVTL